MKLIRIDLDMFLVDRDEKRNTATVRLREWRGGPQAYIQHLGGAGKRKTYGWHFHQGTKHVNYPDMDAAIEDAKVLLGSMYLRRGENVNT